jgi:hypothetical protein
MRARALLLFAAADCLDLRRIHLPFGNANSECGQRGNSYQTMAG